MTQTSGKTGLGVGFWGEEEGLQRACEGGGCLIPPSQAVKAQSPGGPCRELVLPSVIMRNHGQAGTGSASRMTWEGEFDFPDGCPCS